MAAGQKVCFELSPEVLDEVELRAVGRQEAQIEVLGLPGRQMSLDQLGFVEAGIVQHDDRELALLAGLLGLGLKKSQYHFFRTFAFQHCILQVVSGVRPDTDKIDPPGAAKVSGNPVLVRLSLERPAIAYR